MLGLIAPVIVALLAALALGGSIDHWSTQRVRWWPLALLALGVQLLLYSPPLNSWSPVVAVGTTLGVATTLLALIVLVRNAVRPLHVGLLVAALGIALNLAVILANGGLMPRAGAASDAILARGTEPTAVNTASLGPETQLAWLGDTIVQPAWLPLANKISLGDILLSLGAAWWAFTVTAAVRPRSGWST